MTQLIAVAPRAADPPAPPRPPIGRAILAGLAVIALFFGGFGAWAALAPLSSAAVAPGEVRVDSHRKTIQHLEGGIIGEILVREGEAVAAGQVLLRLDDTQAGAALGLLRGQHDALSALAARLAAERDDAPAVRFPPALKRRRDDPRVQEMLAGQETIFAGHRRALLGELDILRRRVAQLRAEIDGHRAQVTALEIQSKLIKQEAATVGELLAKGLERKSRLLALQRQAAFLDGDRAEQQSLIARAEQAIGEAELETADRLNARATDVATLLRETQGKLAELEERLRAAADVAVRTEVVAPQAGRVVNLRHFTPGGVLQSGEAILDLVPQDDKLVIEAQVQPLDIDAVRAGLSAQVTLSAFKQRRTPMILGTVVDVSADRMADRERDRVYYLVRVEIDSAQLAALDGVTLYPGMPAEVLVVTGERTMLDYLLDPVRDSFRRAFRED